MMSQGTVRVYVAGGWFSDVQSEQLNRVAEAIKANPTVAYGFEPQAHQGSETYGTERWADLTFSSDVQAMNNADVIVASLNESDLDSGTVWELGYMTAAQKPAVIVYDGTSLNLMPARGAGLYINLNEDKGLTSEHFGLEELATLDFNALPTNKWLGGML